MPKPNFKMLVKLQIGEPSRRHPRAVKTPRGAQQGDLILVVREADDQEDVWGVLTVPLLSGEDEWCYTQMSYEEVCKRLEKQLHESNCNFTPEDFIDRFTRSMRARGVGGAL